MKKIVPVIVIVLTIFLVGCGNNEETTKEVSADYTKLAEMEYEDKSVIEVNNNKPELSDISEKEHQTFSELDSLGRCGTAEACIGINMMPTEERGSIGMVKPSGWHTVKYDNVEGKYLYNRCHLIGFQLTGENANEKNLITGTRYMNASENSMLTYENMVASYIKNTKNRVKYKVTPVFKDDELVARGVQIQAESVEDDGISFNVYCFNVQPNISIDYKTGESHGKEETKANNMQEEVEMGNKVLFLNIRTSKFHDKTCRYATGNNIEQTKLSVKELEKRGYEPCKICNPHKD